MASAAQVAKRRHSVGELWLVGTPVGHIATTLEVSPRTVDSDIRAIKDALRAERQADLEARRDRSVAVLRKVQRSAWVTVARTRDEASIRVGALNTIMRAEHEIARLEGTLDADISINQNMTLTLADQEQEFNQVQEVIAQALMAFPEARIAVASALAKMP
jgi:hypothetical protein